MYFSAAFLVAVLPLFARSALAAAAAAAAPAAAAAAGGADSLTLNPAVIASGFAQDGQETPTAGQVPSLTSTNNFINFCATVPQLPLTNGQQVTTGSCNPAPMGDIPAKAKMPSCKFQFPINGDKSIAANAPFTIKLKINQLKTGNFVNAQANYFSAPQQIDPATGDILGHSHVVVESLKTFQDGTPANPTVFAFFKGLNGVADGQGILTADVTGLPAGNYKVSSINTAANHQPCLVPVAQHGSLDDVVYFTVGAAAGAAAPAAAAAAAAPAAGVKKAGRRDAAPPRRSYRARLSREIY